ncbi:Tex family protein [uncultured Thiothrix sp.]|uniref:Tex family protein n=1 Tax=uncultured Thiothrix sp. TaxID=223185 RepID=UPI0026107E13|nr:Tex family protein [uncultured Thiothrix sp.]HMT92910.1 Tex family protein [Thiolinea sp.]
MLKIADRIAQELAVAPRQVTAAIQLLDEGSTVPFISRYRKEMTGGLDDSQLRNLAERLGYLRELEERRTAVLKSIEEQGKLTPNLASAIQAADTKTRLEDLYLPFKQKRRTKGQVAIEAGMLPLAEALLANPQLDPNCEAQKYLNKAEEFKEAFVDAKGVLEGVKYILMERFAEDPELVGELRTYLQSEAQLKSSVVKGKETEGAKFRDYFDNADTLKNAPSHRVLAMLRGRNEGILQLSIDVEQSAEALLHPCEVLTAKRLGIQNKQRPADAFLAEVVHWTWKVKLHTKLETDLLGDMRQAAETEAIRVFAHNLKDLLLAAPAGQRATLGLDPGLRTGVKVAVIDSTGQFVDHTTIYPHAPRNQWKESIAILAKLAKKYQLELVAIGNGTASRETDKLVAELLKQYPELNLQKVVVSEAGASVYSASEMAAKEFPDLDVTIRGAVSIARRLQDPLAELVKIEPKSIGVGQYQHDVSQVQLANNLDAVVEDCVNSVGVEVNTASAALLRRVAGLNSTIADNIVEFRNKNGRFTSRKNLLNVPRLGAKTFEQAAGFLRIHGGENPLDSSAVHPEAYSVVEAIAAKTQTNLQSLIGNSALLKSLNAADFTNAKFGLPTVTDILAELDKPGRDPRPAFKTASFKEGVESLADLKVDMLLEGVVTNVTNFGAFVDIGVHQEGLVHISMLAHHFVKDPHSVVKAGDIVKVKVLEVDQERKRIALSMRLDEPANTNNKLTIHPKSANQPSNAKAQTATGKSVRPQQTMLVGNNAFAAAFAKAKERN